MAAQAPANSPAQAAPVMPVVEFTAAAHEHVEPVFDISNIQPNTTSQQFGPFDVPAYGFLRHIYFQVSTTTAGTAGTLSADGPWNLFQTVELLDTNGAPIVSLDGYSLYLANLGGAYAFRQDPALHPDFVGTTTTFTFGFRIPVEINHNNAFGAIGNQNSAASYKVRFAINPTNVTWSVVPTTAPILRIRAHLEAWSQPELYDLGGRPQAQVPPFHGTTQYWSKVNKTLAVGDQTFRVDRLGSLIRTLMFVFRDASGLRQSTIAADPMVVNWDARQLTRMTQYVWRNYMSERYLFSALPNGVFIMPFTHDVLGHAGDGTTELYLPTVQATRLELQGSNFGVAGSVDIITNDVAPVETSPQQRYVEGSATGFHPAGSR